MKLTDLFQENIMLEMANLYPRRTGIGYVMWFGEVGGQHGPKLKVSNKSGQFAFDDNFTLSVSKTPEVITPPGSVHVKQHELSQIIKWIQINYDDLMLLWQIHEAGDDIKLPDGSFLDAEHILSRLKKV